MAGEERGSAAGEEEPLVGVERAWPVLLRLMGVLGFVLPRRRSSGHYEIAYVRLIPMVGITAVIGWHSLTFPKKFTDVAYDVFMDILSYITGFAHVVYAFAVALHRRRETCRFFESLDGTLKPARTWVSCAAFLFFSLFVAFFLGLNYNIADWTNISSLHWICFTLIMSLLPAFLDLYLMILINAVARRYRGLVRLLPSGRRSWTSPGDSGASVGDARALRGPSIAISRRPNPLQDLGDLSSVASILSRCQELTDLVQLYNQIFSDLLLLSCGSFLAKMMNSSYYLAINVHIRIYDSVIYSVSEVGRFYLLCRQADSLKEAHSTLEDALLALHQRRDTPPEDRDSLLSQLVHLKSRPAHIAIGSVGVLGSDVLVTCVNVALTYTAIVFQYRPSEGGN
ncbi:hypothetical protein C7M84_008747 [Penaeus vannamei]|uniref:Gustatory receptor n=1 Tax=Penaeus vannamei TaxID=6689 RepID=A0A3R7SSB2_PENVA|nr:hypothetical protein C7M84_008747 [Penaeus vannamei]